MASFVKSAFRCPFFFAHVLKLVALHVASEGRWIFMMSEGCLESVKSCLCIEPKLFKLLLGEVVQNGMDIVFREKAVWACTKGSI